MHILKWALSYQYSLVGNDFIGVTGELVALAVWIVVALWLTMDCRAVDNAGILV